jgi:hypothetical protein
MSSNSLTYNPSLSAIHNVSGRKEKLGRVVIGGKRKRNITQLDKSDNNVIANGQDLDLISALRILGPEKSRAIIEMHHKKKQVKERERKLALEKSSNRMRKHGAFRTSSVSSAGSTSSTGSTIRPSLYQSFENQITPKIVDESSLFQGIGQEKNSKSNQEKARSPIKTLISWITKSMQ